MIAEGRGGYGGGGGVGSPRLSSGNVGESWRSPVQTDEAVQQTHMDAALAKASCARLGYFRDEWTELLVRGSQAKRSPLIHRGYWTRVAAIRRAVKNFLASCPDDGKGLQIVNLGSGFDTLYFWIKAELGAREDLVFFEVDFPELLSRKTSAIIKKNSLWAALGATDVDDLVRMDSATGTRVLSTPRCRYVPADMRIIQELETAMGVAGFRDDIPTLFLCECVLVYMQALHGDSIIEFAGRSVPRAPSAIVAYEQTNPDDPFGKVMVGNLMQRGCPLLSIHTYPTLDSQRERYMTRGFTNVSVSDMNDVVRKNLDQADVERIQKIEMLDELEEWYLIQGHYFLLTASRSPDEAGSWIHSIA